MKTEYDWLRCHWNSGMSLKRAVRNLAQQDIPKQTVVDFWRKTSREIGYSASIKMPVKRGRRQTREDIISEYSGYIGGIFGPTYADWCGTSVNAELVKAGYEKI